MKEVGGHFQEQFENFAIDGSKAKKEFAKKKSREKRMKSTFLHSFFYFFIQTSTHFFFLNALLKSAMQTRKSSAKELTHFCWWEHRVRLASRQFLGLDYLVPHILRTLMDRVAKFDL